jgi:pimeloyl-ACP methyl ester carboxylesterase
MRRTPREIVIWLGSIAGILLGALAALFLLIATGLALVPSPKLTYAASTLKGKAVACRDSAGVRCFRMRDGARLAARTLPPPASGNRGPSPLTVVLLHGILSTGAELETAARELQAATGARVIRLDLRGHGLSAHGPAETPGDLAHIGQWEEDAADVVAALRRESPGAPIVLGGHSMGGGIAMRYALRRQASHDVPDVDGYLLFAPHLGERSPTTRQAPASSPKNAGGKSAPPPIRVNVPRILGLALLNLARIHALNGLDVLAFDLPFPLPFRSYTFRAIASSAPEDYRAALKADAKPLLVVVGAQDEAFHAEEYPAVVALHRNGKAVIVPGASHDGVLRNPAALAAAEEWIKASYGARDSRAAASSTTPVG